MLIGSSTAIATAVAVISTQAAYAQSADDYLNSGVSKFSSHNFQGALDDFNKAIEIDPENANAYGNRGSVRGITGDIAGACEDYQKGIDLGDCPNCVREQKKHCHNMR